MVRHLGHQEITGFAKPVLMDQSRLAFHRPTCRGRDRGWGVPPERLPGAGGAPEIAASAREVLIILRQSRRTFVEKVEFVTSAGFLNGGNERSLLGIPGAGPKAVITDLGVLTPDPHSKELVLSQIHPGITFEQVRAATGWDLRASGDLATTEAPTVEQLRALRDLKQRTEVAHAGGNGSTGRGNGQSRKVA